MSKRTWLPALVLAVAASRLEAQTVAVTKLDEATFRHAAIEERRSIFAANLALPPGELVRFWEIYDEYAKERAVIETQRFTLLQRYAQSYAALNDEQAMAIVLASGQLQVSDVQLRLKYTDRLRKKMSGKVAARFFQIDDYVTSSLRMNMLSGVPLVAPR